MVDSAAKNVEKVYDQWGKDYDEFMPWEKKFRNESNYYMQIFRQNNVKKVHDAGCGTGRHALYFAQAGYEVTGSDISSGMLQKAEERAKAAGYQINWVHSSFQELADKVDKRYDCLFSGGTALAHILDEEELLIALNSIREVLVPGGILITDNINGELKAKKGLSIGPLEVPEGPEGQDSDKLWLRVLNTNWPIINYNVVTMEKIDGKWDMVVKTFDLRGDIHVLLRKLLPKAGFEIISDEPNSDYGGTSSSYQLKHGEPRGVFVARRI